jgi:hypothetical protein
MAKRYSNLIGKKKPSLFQRELFWKFVGDATKFIAVFVPVVVGVFSFIQQAYLDLQTLQTTQFVELSKRASDADPLMATPALQGLALFAVDDRPNVLKRFSPKEQGPYLNAARDVIIEVLRHERDQRKKPLYNKDDANYKYRPTPKERACVEALSTMNRIMSKTDQRLDLSYRDLTDLYLDRAYLNGVIAKHTRFEGSDLRRAELKGANLAGAYFGVGEGRAHAALLAGAHLEGADLSFAWLGETDLSEASLHGTDLTCSYIYIIKKATDGKQQEKIHYLTENDFRNEANTRLTVNDIDYKGKKPKWLTGTEAENEETCDVLKRTL